MELFKQSLQHTSHVPGVFNLQLCGTPHVLPGLCRVFPDLRHLEPYAGGTTVDGLHALLDLVGLQILHLRGGSGVALDALVEGLQARGVVVTLT
jgi:hypothetical protein